MGKGDQEFEALYEYHARQLLARSGPKDGVVYHYTDAFGLEGILRTGSLRATDFRFLNDRTEFLHGSENAKRLCRALARKTDQTRLRNFLNKLSEYLEIADEENRSFVASFTDKKDDLSQWRGYANDGQGYTVGLHADWFTTKCLHDDCEFAFYQVAYSPEKFRSEVTHIIDGFFRSLSNPTNSEERESAASWCDVTIENTCTAHKHRSFEAESEWRLVTHISGDEMKDIKVRPKQSGLVPYVEIDLRDKNGKIPLHSVGVGPSIRNRAGTQAVNDLCRQYGYDCDVYAAETPYNRT